MCGCSFVCLSQVLSKFSEIEPAEVAESRFMAKLPSAQDLGGLPLKIWVPREFWALTPNKSTDDTFISGSRARRTVRREAPIFRPRTSDLV